MLLGDPIVKTYQHHAYPFSVLANDLHSSEWVYNNFIQLKCENNIPIEEEIYFDFLNSGIFGVLDCPFLQQITTFRNQVEEDFDNIHNFFEYYIQEGFYIYLFVNIFYLPNVYAYETFHNSHDILLNGFDKRTRQYNVSGYSKNYRSFSKWKVSFEDIEKAYNGIESLDIKKFHNNIVMFRNKSFSYKFNFSQLVYNLQDYLNSSTKEELSQYKNQEHLVFGIGTFEILLNYIELLANKKVKFDIRPFCLLEEHKALMQKRVKFLIHENKLLTKKDFEDRSYVIGFNSVIIRNLMLKYSITKNSKILIEVYSKITKIKKDEESFINDILFELMKEA